MAQDVNKWQLREAEALAAEEGLSVDDALARVQGKGRRARKAPVVVPQGGDKDPA